MQILLHQFDWRIILISEFDITIEIDQRYDERWFGQNDGRAQ